MASIYFNSEFIGDKVPCTERFRGLCFRPLHYFFEGKTRTWDKGCFGTQDSYPANQKSWPTALKMAILIVPGLIVGTIAAVVAYVHWYFTWNLDLFHGALNREWVAKYETPVYVKKDQDTPFIAPSYELPADFSLNQSHTALYHRWFTFISKLTSPESWKNPAIRTEFGALIEAAYKEMDLLLQHAAKAAGNDPAKMAQLMADEHKPREENYCRVFFRGSIGPMYYAAWARECFEKTEGGGLTKGSNNKQHQDAMSSENTQPFFTPSTSEYRWRRLYNAACALIDRYPGLREALKLEDERILNCAFPHLSPSSECSDWMLGITVF